MRIINTRILASLLIGLSLVAFACKQNGVSSAEKADSDSLQIEEEPQDTLASYDQRIVWEGKIGDYPIMMDLEITGDSLKGVYRYLSQEQTLRLEGRQLPNGEYSLQEYDPEGKQSGILTGSPSFQGRFTGSWMQPDSSGQLLIEMMPSRVEMYRTNAFLPSRFRYDVNHIERFSKGRSCVINIYYPYFYDLPSKVLEKINTAMTGPADSILDRQIEECQVDDMPGEMGSEVMEGFQVVSITGPILCLTRDFYAYFSGAAHGNYGSETFNFDLRTGELLSPMDLFEPGYDSTFNQLIRQRLNEQFGPDAEYLSFESVHSKQNYEITADSLITYFDPYEIAPYAAGQIRVAMGLNEIEDFIRKDGPLGLR